MSKHRLPIGFAVALVMLTILACGFHVSTANIKSARMARDYDGNQPTTVFAPDETFYCVVELANAPDDTMVKAAWTTAEVEGTDPNSLIDEAELTTGSDTLHFKLTNDGLWPNGKYKVDLYLNGKLDRTLEFEVQSS
jgi:hypothetical protein